MYTTFVYMYINFIYAHIESLYARIYKVCIHVYIYIYKKPKKPKKAGRKAEITEENKKPEKTGATRGSARSRPLRVCHVAAPRGRMSARLFTYQGMYNVSHAKIVLTN